MDSSPLGSSIHGILQARILEWVVIFLLQGIFPNQELNQCLLQLLHCRQILYRSATLALFILCLGFPGNNCGKEPTCQCRRRKRREFHPWVGKIPWRRSWQPTPVFLPGESNGQRSLAGYSPQCCKELDTTEATACTHAY